MGRSPTQAAHSSVSDLLPSFTRHLRAENKSPSTIVTYGKAVEQLADFLGRDQRPTTIDAVQRADIEAFLVDLQVRGARPATVAQRFRSIQQYWKWLAAEGEIPVTPMAGMRPPKIPEEPPPVITPDELRRLLASCDGTSFDDRRDNAILRLLMDTGMRRGELAGLKVADLDFDHDVAVVMGKGRKPRACPFGKRTAQAVDRYLRARARHDHADSPWLWLGKQGRLTDNGVLQMVRRRGRQVGIEHVYVHLFRHTYAHQMLADGVQEGDLMRLGGWKSREMLDRYGRSAADERARNTYREHSPVDRL